jgi:CubicO group peptidase (beta-lactamase class C family)
MRSSVDKKFKTDVRTNKSGNLFLKLFKSIQLKNTLLSALLLLLLYSCGMFTGHKKPAAEDSLDYYPPTPGLADKNEFRSYYRAIATIMDSALANRIFNGAILVAKNGNIIYEKYTGFKDLKTEPVDSSTSFHIASTSKTFTGMAILRLVQQGKLKLDDSLQRYFPGFPYPSVTVQMLLCHRSGIPNYIYFISNSNWPGKKMVFNEDVLNFLLKEQPKPDFKAGTRFSYSNTNYVLLAMLAEKITGQPFPLYMQQQFFIPLQMKNSFVFTWSDSAKVIYSYSASGNRWEYDNLEGTYGDKNIFSTPRDLLKWDQALYTDQIIRKTLLDSAFTPYSFERPSIHNYGLGWRMMIFPTGKKIIYHNGRWHGFNSAFARLTDEKAVIIVLGNRQSWLPYQAAVKSYNVFGSYFPQENMESEENGQDSLLKAPDKPVTPKLKRPPPGKKRKR